uniref:Probable G-protein coupled receptor 152 n=1 Tax=Geotrypetes seraphini TaxID=260995 RepID=A0A6P8P6T8_GEOSA|nr:probable G-protein coupled receptor 152 [Geotrypetes seraphini]XP_033776579.1 probable G-protein coupled receptor 152 [Geotrypetes seraphini]XP_033776580.1 probable G-protein coupled receptor 152 [Geotrypetes seraphini]
MTELSTRFANITLTDAFNMSSMNDTFDAFTTADIVLISFSLIFSLLGLVGNGIVLWFLGFKIKRNKFTIYILNLATADLMFLLCCLVVLLCILLDTGTSIAPWTVLQFLLIFGYYTGLYLLTAISMERCLSVLYPIWYQCKRPRHLSAFVCGFLWVLSCLVTGLEFFVCVQWDEESLNGLRGCQFALFMFICILTFLIFTPLMVISSLTLLIKIRMSSQRHHQPKLYIVIVTTVFIFCVFAMPLRILSLLWYQQYHYPEIVEYLTILFSSINSTANPFIYFLVGSQGKQIFEGFSILGALQRVFKEDSEISMRQEIESTRSNLSQIERRYIA